MSTRHRRTDDEPTPEQQRIDGQRPGGDADRHLEGLAQLLWVSSPDSSWGEVAVEAKRQGLIGDTEGDR